MTTGRSRLPFHRNGEPSRHARDDDINNNDEDRDYLDLYAEKYDLEYDSGFPSTHSGVPKSGAGLAVPFIGVIVIAVVVAIIFIIISVKLMKSYCCFCKDEEEEANEPEVNPFKDYAPSKGDDAAPPLVRERVISIYNSLPLVRC